MSEGKRMTRVIIDGKEIEVDIDTLTKEQAERLGIHVQNSEEYDKLVFKRKMKKLKHKILAVTPLLALFVYFIYVIVKACVTHTAIQAFQAIILLILFFVRIVLLILTSNSGAMGGMFVPVLTIGALLGGLLGKMSIEMGLPADYYQTVGLITMTAFMGAVMRAPITAILLIVEMTGHFSSGFLATAISVLIAYLIVEMLKIEPLYEKALHDAYKDVNKDKGHKQVYEFNTIVEKGSFVEGRQVKDILWPYGCTISTVIKTDEVGNEIYSTDKAGDRIIRAGQTYIVKALVYDIEQTKKEMEYLCKNYSYKETADMGVENAREMFGIKNFKKRKDKEKSNSDSVNETRSEDGNLRNSNGNESDGRICGTLNSEKSADINSDGKESFGVLSETVQTACVDDTEGDRTEEKHNDGKD